MCTIFGSYYEDVAHCGLGLAGQFYNARWHSCGSLQNISMAELQYRMFEHFRRMAEERDRYELWCSQWFDDVAGQIAR